MSSLRTQMRYLNPYDLHKLLINEYVLKQPGDTKRFKRNNSRDRTDYDVIKDNHRFLWDDNDSTNSWETEFAKKYYDKLFKEYCIGDLSLYKENKIALRWRIQQEVVIGKGQFICGSKRCNEKEDLKTWEVNFSYTEQGEKKNALVKIRLCPDCSKKLNYHSKKREVKRLQKPTRPKQKHKPENKHKTEEKVSSSEEEKIEETDPGTSSQPPESPWESLKPVETKSREAEMEEYLEDLLL